MQSRSQWDFFDMQIESANKGGGDEGVFFPSKIKKKYISEIVMTFCWKRKTSHSTFNGILSAQGQTCDCNLDVEFCQIWAPIHASKVASDMNLLLFAIRLHQSM